MDKNNGPAEQDRLYEQKEVAYYSALVQAWVSTRIEKDKTLIAVSAGGIGLLVHLISTSNQISCPALIVGFAAILLFLITIIMALWILGRNADLLKRLIKEKDSPANESSSDEVLKLLDRGIKLFFCMALIVSILFGGMLGYKQIQARGDQEMSSEKENITTRETLEHRGEGWERKSLEGIQNLRPSRPAPQGSASGGEGSSGGGDNKGSNADK